MKSSVAYLTGILAGCIIMYVTESFNPVDAKQQPVFAQTCSPGLIIRPNGAIMLDAWKSYDAPIAGDPGAVKFPNLGVPQPVSVHFGYTLPNELKVCFEGEEADGSSCVPLFKLRSTAFGGPPDVGMPGYKNPTDNSKPPSKPPSKPQKGR